LTQGGDEIAFAGLARQAEMVRAGEVSPTELVGQSLERIDRLDPELNAFRKVFADKAMLEAEQAEARRGAGDKRPLLGVPIAIKDEIDVAGEVNTHGTDAFEVPAKADSEVVRRLREAGAIIVGLTLLPELAICGFTESATYGVTRNPWNRQRTPGRLAWDGGRRLCQPLGPRHRALARRRLRRLGRGRSSGAAGQTLRRVRQGVAGQAESRLVDLGAAGARPAQRLRRGEAGDRRRGLLPRRPRPRRLAA
jgi:hypothetical protein